MEALNFSKSMLDSSKTDNERCAMLLKAMNKQTASMVDCCNLKGCDRHLLALSIMAEEEGLPLPEIYTDPAWTKSGGGGNFILSTSFTGYSEVLGGAVAMCEHGYGVFYCIQDKVMDFCVTSYHSSSETDSLKFFNTITKTMNEMRELFDTNHTVLAHKL